MLFHSSIRRELARSFGATLLVLFTIVVTIMLIRTLSLASAGSVDPQEVVLVLGYTVLGRLNVILTMALFISVVSVLSRMHSDSEMVIWMGSGRGLLGMAGPIFRFAWPVLAAMAVLVMLAWPWANQQAAELRDRFAQRGDLERVQPGQFQSDSQGKRVFFIDKDTVDGTQGRNVFISAVEPRGESTTSARAATIQTTDGIQYLRLLNGQRLETANDLASLRVSEFDEYLVSIDTQVLATDRSGSMRTRSTWQLVQEPSAPAMGELTWRVGLVLSAINLLLVALAIASGNPRAGRSGNTAFALFAFLTYYNLLNLGETWVSRGDIQPLAWLMLLHGTVAVLALAWLYKRHENISLRALWRSRLQGSAA
jgi:lipopolysaccharide export system permease protein